MNLSKKHKDKFRQLSGALDLLITDSAGNALYTFKHHNLIVNGGYLAAAMALAGVPGSSIANIQVGRSFLEPEPEDTMITDAVTIPILSVEYPDNFSVRFNFLINANTANGLNIAEFGLITQDGRLFSRLVRTEIISKTNAIEIMGGWVINL